MAKSELVKGGTAPGDARRQLIGGEFAPLPDKPDADADHIVDANKKVDSNIVAFIDTDTDAEDSAADCPDDDAKLASDIAEVAPIALMRASVENVMLFHRRRRTMPGQSK